MTKHDFLNKLRMALSGRVSPSLVEDNISYYEEYINTQLRLGKSEIVVMEALGDPRLIAKTIIMTNGTDAARKNMEYQEVPEREDIGMRIKKRFRDIRIPGWVIGLIVVVLFISILSVLFSIISFLLPVLLPLMLVAFLIKLFRDWLD